MEMMTTDHERWEEFAGRLEGPGACDFREDPKRGFTWKCAGGKDKSFAEAILADMGFSAEEIVESCTYFEDHGGYCDCEILFNVDLGR